MKRFTHYILVLTSIILASCDDYSPESMYPTDTAHYLSVDNTSLEFSNQASTQTIYIESKNIPWQIVGMPDWLTVAPNSGSTNSSVNISVTDNEYWKVTRNCNLRLISEDTKYHYNIIIDVKQTEILGTCGHDYVDLGLTSGLIWATMNVGATSETDYGYYYAWGETKPKSTTYTFSSNPTTLPLINDAAHVNWGGNWRMPTEPEFLELYEECTWTWSTRGNKSGYLVTSKKNSNSIFLPAAGRKIGDGAAIDMATAGYYWSSWMIYYNNKSYSYYLEFKNIGSSTNYVNPWNYNERYYGQSVRPVLSK